MDLLSICKFGTKFATKFDTNFGRAYLLLICIFGTKFSMPSAQVWYQWKREVHNVNAQAYEDCGQIWCNVMLCYLLPICEFGTLFFFFFDMSTQEGDGGFELVTSVS